jgi:hypothetical protein
MDFPNYEKGYQIIGWPASIPQQKRTRSNCGEGEYYSYKCQFTPKSKDGITRQLGAANIVEFINERFLN